MTYPALRIAKVDELLDQLEERYKGLTLIRLLPERTLAEVVSFGERMSSVIVAAMLENASHHNSLDFIKTEKWFNRNIADRGLTEKLIKEEFALPLERHAVAGGFISTDRNTGEITNLGRGGSDYTAALIAACQPLVTLFELVKQFIDFRNNLRFPLFRNQSGYYIIMTLTDHFHFIRIVLLTFRG